MSAVKLAKETATEIAGNAVAVIVSRSHGHSSSAASAVQGASVPLRERLIFGSLQTTAHHAGTHHFFQFLVANCSAYFHITRPPPKVGL